MLDHLTIYPYQKPENYIKKEVKTKKNEIPNRPQSKIPFTKSEEDVQKRAAKPHPYMLLTSIQFNSIQKRGIPLLLC